MPASARLTDIWSGICCCHVDPTCIPMSGPIITGSPDAKTNGLSQARLTDMTIGGCGHTGTIVSASSVCKANGLGRARIGDQVSGCNIGTIITGSPDAELG